MNNKICRTALNLLAIGALFFTVLPAQGYSPIEIRWNPPGDPYGSGGTAGVPIPSPYEQDGFTVEYNGYAEEDSHALTLGTHWTGRVGVNFVRAPQAPDNTEIKIFRNDGTEFWLNALNFTLDATSVKTINVQGFRDGAAVTELITMSGLSTGDANFFFNDPAFGNIDEVRITAAQAIRGYLRPMSYHPTPLNDDEGTDLSPGDIAIIAVSTIHSDLSFITLADLPGDSYVYFTTQGWNSQTGDWVGDHPALVAAGYLGNGYFWKTPAGGVPRGTIINYLAAPGEISSDWIWLNTDDDWLAADQWLVFTKSTSNPSETEFVYAANFFDLDEDGTGFQTTFGTDDHFRTAVPPGLTAAASGAEGSAFGLAPTGGYDLALKTSVLTDGMSREEVLQAIHTPANWEVYNDGDAYAGFDLSSRYPASITMTGDENQSPTDIALSNSSVNQSGGVNAVVGSFGTADADIGDTHSYSLVAGTGDANNAQFNISGSSLRANDAGALPEGGYSVRVQTDDGKGGTFSKDFTIAVVDDVAPIVTDLNISISGGSGAGPTYRIGDTVTATWNNTGAGDNNSDTIVSVTVDFSQFGGGAAVSATNFSGIWRAAYTVVAGSTSGTNQNISIRAVDNAGNATTTFDSTGAIVDNIAPQIVSIKRKTPSIQLVREGPVVFEVTFSEDVASVLPSSFAVTAVNESSVTGAATSVSGGPRVYEVTVGITGGTGEFRLDVAE